MLNHIYILLKLHPEWINSNSRFNFEWYRVNKHPNITWEMIQELSELFWNYDYISHNPNITWDIVQKFPKKNWDMDDINRTIKLTPEFLNSGKINWEYLSSNPNLTQEIYLNNLNKPWNYYELSDQMWLTWELIIQDPEKWYWSKLVCNPALTWNINKTWQVLHTNGLKFIGNWSTKWNYDDLSNNINLTWNLISQNPDKSWNFERLSKFIDMEIINQNPGYGWNFYYISVNPTLTWKMVKQHLDKNWNWKILSKRFLNLKRFNKYQEKVKETIYTELGMEPGDNFNYLSYKYITDKSQVYSFIDNIPNVKEYNLGLKYFKIWKLKIQNRKLEGKRWKAEFLACVDFIKNQQFYQ